MKKKVEKKCNREKCPYYKSLTLKCISCEWNPNAVWVVRKEKGD